MSTTLSAGERIRPAALAWLDDVTLGGELPLSRGQLANDFTVDGVRFPLIDRGRGIREPAGPCDEQTLLT